MEEKIREIGRELLKYPNVVGFSNKIRKRIRKGKVVDEDVIRVYVSKKLPESKLKPSDIIPKEVDGIPTDVVEIGRIRAVDTYTERYRPAPAGVSVGRADENAAGTLGWFMVDSDGNIYLLSNNHVFAKENLGQQGDPIVQPGVYDGGNPSSDVIGYLYGFVPIDFTGNPNYCDCAVATPASMGDIYVSIMAWGGVTGKATPSVDMKAYKIGRSTGLTEGYVYDDSASVNVEYKSGTAYFEDVFIVQGSNIVKPGDSGSPVLTENGEFLGLLFAGNDNGTHYVACKQTYIEQNISSATGKTMHILVANAPKPFEKQIVYVKPSITEVVEQASSAMIQMLSVAMLILPIIGLMKAFK